MSLCDLLLISEGEIVMKKIIIIAVVFVVIGVGLYIGYSKYVTHRFNMMDGIGKIVYIDVEKSDIIDYSEMDKYTLIPRDKREVIVQYMKDNNLKLKRGKYKFNQGEPTESILKILKFTENE